MIFTQGICEKVRESLIEVYGGGNPFDEKWKRGRPSLEQLIRKDFWWLWQEDNSRPVGLLSNLRKQIDCKCRIIPIKGAKRKISLKYIQRGTEN